MQPTIQSLEPSASPSLVQASSVAQPPGQVNASPFNIVFETSEQPSESDLLTAGTLTLQYLQEFLTAQFEFNSETELVEPSGTVTATDVTQALVAFDVSLLFSEGRFVPTSSDIDNLLFAAFQSPFVDGLLTYLR